MSPSIYSCGGGGGGGGGGISKSSSSFYIQHQVSKMDTLAGIAIKYGVEVADIKRSNGLATDIQMFALKTLLIPSPGRHPPSPVVSSTHPPSPPSPPRANGVHKTPPRPRCTNFSESSESLRLNSHPQSVSPAMSTLQKYYRLQSSNQKGKTEGTEMAVHRTGSLDSLNEDRRLRKASPFSAPPCGNKKHRNFFGSFFSENDAMVEGGNGDAEKSNEKSVRRRQTADTYSRVGFTERSLKEQNGGGGGGFSLVTVIAGGLSGFRKSSSTSSLQEDTGSSFWSASKWSLKSDLQALSSAAISIRMFDGLPNPLSGRKSKAALD